MLMIVIIFGWWNKIILLIFLFGFSILKFSTLCMVLI